MMHGMRFYEQYAEGVGGSTFNQCLIQKKRNDAWFLLWRSINYSWVGMRL